MEHQIEIPRADWEKAARAVIPCMAKGDERYYLNGMAVENVGNRVRLVGIDGHRLGLVQTAVRCDKRFPAAIIPERVVKWAERTRYKARKDDRPVVLSFANERFAIDVPVKDGKEKRHVDDAKLGQDPNCNKLIDGKVPDYRKVVVESRTTKDPHVRMLARLDPEMRGRIREAHVLAREVVQELYPERKATSAEGRYGTGYHLFPEISCFWRHPDVMRFVTELAFFHECKPDAHMMDSIKTEIEARLGAGSSTIVLDYEDGNRRLALSTDMRPEKVLVGKDDSLKSLHANTNYLLAAFGAFTEPFKLQSVDGALTFIGRGADNGIHMTVMTMRP